MGTLASELGPHAERIAGQPRLYIDANVPKDDSLFVFPDVVLVYGLTDREPYRKVPAFYMKPSFPVGVLHDEFHDHFLADPPRWILWHDQTGNDSFEPHGLMKWFELSDFVDASYVETWHFGDFKMLRRND